MAHDQKPGIYPEAMPPSEHAHCDSINGDLFWLQSYIEDFERGLKLFHQASMLLDETYRQSPRGEPQAFDDLARLRRYSEDTRLFGYWRLAAARDCALTFYDFGCVVEGLHQTLKDAPTLKTLMNRNKLGAARELFNRLFGGFENVKKLRHGSTHGEKLHTTDAVKVNIITDNAVAQQFNTTGGDGPSYVRGSFVFGPQSQALVSIGIRGKQFSSTWQKELFTLDICEQTMENMGLVRDAYYEAFYTLEAATREARTRLWSQSASQGDPS